MKLFGLDVTKIILAFLVTFGILTGGRIAAYHVQVERPLESFLREHPDVVDWRLVRGGSAGLEVRVRLREVGDIQATYMDLCDGLARAAGRMPVLVIQDGRTRELSATYRRMRFAVEEAIARGTFQEMAKAIDSEAKEAGLDRWGVYVDSGNVYLQLHKGGHYLYEVIPRHEPSTSPDDAAGLGSRVRATLW
ncbi:MAG: hypothetical protein GX492_13170 [Firmicutes bacterium]|nr:hypothetical protein [Bacillota bacterium]